MALPLVITNTVQVRLLFAIAGNGAANVLHGIAAGGVVVNQALADALGSGIKTAYTTHLAPLANAGSGLVRVGVRDIRLANQPEYLDTGATAGGTGTGDSLPPNTAACFTLRTVKSGKSFRGRVYLGGFIETTNDPTGTAAASVGTAGVAFLGAVDTVFSANGLTWAVASRPAERYTIVKTTFHANGTSTVETIGSGNARAGESNEIVAVQHRSNLWESQRRRGNGRGVVPATFSAGSQLQLSRSQAGA